MLNQIAEQAKTAVSELIEISKIKSGDIMVIGCSSSEVGGEKIGTHSSPDIAKAIVDGILPMLKEKGIFLAAQCCEHLNRALIVERAAAEKFGLDVVNVIPQPKAGGSFATAVYAAFDDAVAVEKVSAKAGMDIGNTLIGMHLKAVAVPVRLSIKKIGEAPLVCAKTRPKFVGGARAVYNEELL